MFHVPINVVSAFTQTNQQNVLFEWKQTSTFTWLGATTKLRRSNLKDPEQCLGHLWGNQPITHFAPDLIVDLFCALFDKKTSLQHNNNKEWSVTNWQIIRILQIMLRGPSASSLQLTPWQKAPGVDEGRRLPYALLYPLTCSRLFVTPGLCVPVYLVTSCPAGQAENVTKTYIAAVKLWCRKTERKARATTSVWPREC